MLVTFEDKEAGLKTVNLDKCFSYNLYEDEKTIYFVNKVDEEGNLVGLGYNNDDLKFLRQIFMEITEKYAKGEKWFDITKHYTKYLQLEKGGKNNEKL